MMCRIGCGAVLVQGCGGYGYPPAYGQGYAPGTPGTPGYGAPGYGGKVGEVPSDSSDL
jgi:hypothetical protein